MDIESRNPAKTSESGKPREISFVVAVPVAILVILWSPYAKKDNAIIAAKNRITCIALIKKQYPLYAPILKVPVDF